MPPVELHGLKGVVGCAGCHHQDAEIKRLTALVDKLQSQITEYLDVLPELDSLVNQRREYKERVAKLIEGEG